MEMFLLFVPRYQEPAIGPPLDKSLQNLILVRPVLGTAPDIGDAQWELDEQMKSAL